MNKIYLSLFLSLTTLCMGTKIYCEKTSSSLTIECKIVSSVDESPSDASIWIESLDEWAQIQSFFAYPKSSVDLLKSDTPFVSIFITTTQGWLHHFETHHLKTMVKKLQINCKNGPSQKYALCEIDFTFKKQEKSLRTQILAQIKTPGTEDPRYLKNLINAALEQPKSSYKTAKIAAGLATSAVILGGGIIALSRRSQNAQSNNSVNFFEECSVKLQKISQLVPDSTIKIFFSGKDTLLFSTTTHQDHLRFGSQKINFKLRMASPKDKHSSTYILLDNKKTADNPMGLLANKLIYHINTIDDFITTILVHLLVRIINVGPALEYFEKEINQCPFKHVDVMGQFGCPKSGSLQEALNEYKTKNTLDNFFN